MYDSRNPAPWSPRYETETQERESDLNTLTLAPRTEFPPTRLGIVKIECSYPLLVLALKEVLKGEAHVYDGHTPRGAEEPAVIILYHDEQDIAAEVRRVRNRVPGASVLVFVLSIDPRVALAALRAGACGFIHAGMRPEQVICAVRRASKGERTVPEKLSEGTVNEGSVEANLALLTPRQRQVAEMASEGFSNAQIAKRLYVTESTVKQHLYAVYKHLDVRNRTQVANLVKRWTT
jgi:DNA-binding NarL/FixJ family response regulator